MKTKGISFALILLVGSLVAPIGFPNVQAVSIPSSPTDLSATSVSNSKINLSWIATADSIANQVNGYKIEIGAGCIGAFSPLVANTATTSTTYSSTGLISGLCYEFRVSALNSEGSSAPSNVASATTWSVPAVPTNLNANAVSSSQINLSWLAPISSGGTPIIGYKILRNGTTLVNNTGTTITNYTNSGLLASHQQTYRIAAWNSVGLGPYSVNVTGKTLDQTATSSSVTENLGQMVSEFVHRYNAIFKEQRDATVTAIKACIHNVKDATPEHRKQAKADCKATLSAIREKYKADRKQFQIEFKQFKETAKEELKIARESASITKSDVKEFQKDLNHAKKELKQQEKDLKKELKQQEKDAKKKSKDKNHEEDDD